MRWKHEGRVEAGVVPDAPMAMPRNWKPAIVAAIVLVVILAGVGFAYARYGGKIAARLHRKPAAATVPVGPAWAFGRCGSRGK